MAVSAQDKKKLLSEGQALHKEAYQIVVRGGDTLTMAMDIQKRISAARQKVMKFIQANRGKTAKIKAEIKKFKAFADAQRKSHTDAVNKVMADATACAKKVEAFVKKHKAVLTAGPKLQQLATNLQQMSQTFKAMQKAHSGK